MMPNPTNIVTVAGMRFILDTGVMPRRCPKQTAPLTPEDQLRVDRWLAQLTGKRRKPTEEKL